MHTITLAIVNYSANFSALFETCAALSCVWRGTDQETVSCHVCLHLIVWEKLKQMILAQTCGRNMTHHFVVWSCSILPTFFSSYVPPSPDQMNRSTSSSSPPHVLISVYKAIKLTIIQLFILGFIDLCIHFNHYLLLIAIPASSWCKTVHSNACTQSCTVHAQIQTFQTFPLGFTLGVKDPLPEAAPHFFSLTHINHSTCDLSNIYCTNTWVQDLRPLYTHDKKHRRSSLMTDFLRVKTPLWRIQWTQMEEMVSTAKKRKKERMKKEKEEDAREMRENWVTHTNRNTHTDAKTNKTKNKKAQKQKQQATKTHLRVMKQWRWLVF